MARKKKSGETRSSGGFGDFKLTWIDFSDVERKDIVTSEEQAVRDFPDVLLSAIEDGWKVSISYSIAWDNYVLSLTPKRVDEFSAGSVFMSRHADYHRILSIFHFFFTVMVPNGDDRLGEQDSGHNW